MLNKSTTLTLKLAAIMAVSLPSAGAADIVYSLSKRQITKQTSSATPTGPSDFALMATFDGPDNSFTAVNFFGNGRMEPMVNIGGPNEAVFDYIDSGYSSLAELNTAWSNNTMYTFSYLGGGYNGSHGVYFSAGSFPLSSPTLTGDSWQRAQSLNPNGSLLLSWEAANWGESYAENFIVVEVSNANNYWDFELDADATQIVIPNNTFDSLSQYTVQIHFIKVSSVDEGGLYEGMTGYINTLTFDLHTVPEPATVALALGAFALGGTLVLRRNRRRNAA